MANRPAPASCNDYSYFSEISTRWMDNDVYGHINNVIYYSIFDTVVNEFLIQKGVLNIHSSEVIGLVVETRCNYYEPMAFPQKITAGLCVERISNSSVVYNIGIFGDKTEKTSAQGHFVHVYVDRASRRPVPVPENLRNVLMNILKHSDAAVV